MRAREEYQQGFGIREITFESSLGVLTKRDKLVIGWDEAQAAEQIAKFIDSSYDVQTAVDIFGLRLRDKDMWDASSARKALSPEEINAHIRTEYFRPFDLRKIFYHSQYVARRNRRVMSHLSHWPNEISEVQ